MKKINDQKEIEQYLDGSLDEPSRKAFEERIKSDKAIAKEVAIWQTIYQGMEEMEATTGFVDDTMLENGLTQLQTNLEKEGFFDASIPSKTPNRMGRIFELFRSKPARWIGAASFILLLAFIGILFSREAAYVALNEKVLFDINKRGGDNRQELQLQRLLQEAFLYYNKRTYKQAIPLFEDALKIANSGALDQLTRKYYFSRISIYLSCAYLEDKQVTKAITILEAVYPKEPMIDEVKREACWYLAMAYLENNRPAAALQLLEQLRTDAVYGAAATKKIKAYSKQE